MAVIASLAARIAVAATVTVAATVAATSSVPATSSAASASAASTATIPVAILGIGHLFSNDRRDTVNFYCVGSSRVEEG
ncbi:hypothetical protein D3C87_1594380 [compost metagenome]